MNPQIFGDLLPQSTAIEILGIAQLHWGGLFLSFSIIAIFVFVHWMVNRQRYELSHSMVFDFIIYLTVGAIVGSRLGYCLFVDSDIFFQFKSAAPYWGVLSPEEGGFSSFGAYVGVLISCMLFTIKFGVSRVYLFDLASIVTPISLFFMRLSSFLTGELFGREADQNFPFSVKVINEILFWPKENLEKIKQLSPIFEKINVRSETLQESLNQYPTNVESQIQIHQYLVQAIDYLIKNPNEYFEKVFPLLKSRYPIQIIEAGVQGALIFLILLMAWSGARRPGFITALFLILFSVSEIVLDPYRFQNSLEGRILFGLSEQVVIAIIGLIIGLLMMLVWNRSEILKTPGWGRLSSVRLHRR